MKVTYAPKDILQIDDCRIIFRNFRGLKDKFNAEGNRNFCVVINSEMIANEMIEKGWNVSIKPPRNEGDEPFMTLRVKVKFNDYGPNIWLWSGPNKIRITEDNVNALDVIDIESVDMDIRPFDWEVNGKTGRTAYLQGARIIQKLDRFDEPMTAEKAEVADHEPEEEDDLPF